MVAGENFITRVLIMEKKSLFCFLFLFTFFCVQDSVYAETELTGLIGQGIQYLQIEKGATDLVVLTNANYVRLQGKTTEKYVDEIAAATGCSVGQGNLLLLNERPRNVLLVALGNKRTFQAIVLRYEDGKWETGPLSLKDEDMGNPDYYWDAVQGVSGKQAFHIISILGAWMVGVPYDYLRSAELHGHICPGLFFGYITAKGVETRLPLRDGDKYVYIGSPNECKDDAMQVLLGVTAGKRTMFVKKVNKDQIAEISGRVHTGITIRWSEMDGKGVGLVTSIDMDAVEKITLVGKELPSNQKLLASRKMLSRLADTEMFFRIEQEFKVDRELKEKLVLAGVNPYDELPAPALIDPQKAEHQKK